jgi:uncharacterized protein with GYD domain
MPLKNCASKGRRNEHRSRALLEAMGYEVVRAAASKGAFDLWAIGSKDFIICQVKSNCWPGSVEMETLRAFVAPPNCRKLIHRWRDRQRLPDVKEI